MINQLVECENKLILKRFTSSEENETPIEVALENGFLVEAVHILNALKDKPWLGGRLEENSKPFNRRDCAYNNQSLEDDLNEMNRRDHIQYEILEKENHSYQNFYIY